MTPDKPPYSAIDGQELEYRLPDEPKRYVVHHPRYWPFALVVLTALCVAICWASSHWHWGGI